MVICARCGEKVAKEDTYSHRGQELCEDCYMGALQAPKTCDVAATQHAIKHRKSSGQTGTEGLLEIQKKIVEYLKSEGKATRNQLIKFLNIPEWELDRHIATLRHCELVKGRKFNGNIYLVPFDLE